MRPRSSSGLPTHGATIDSASLYLCRQGRRWVVVIESPRFSGAVPFHYAGHDSNDARFELLTLARRACPDAAIINTDGALIAEDYEWRIEVRGVEGRSGELGIALRRALSGDSTGERPLSRPTVGHRCHWGMSSSASGRPRTF